MESSTTDNQIVDMTIISDIHHANCTVIKVDFVVIIVNRNLAKNSVPMVNLHRVRVS